MRFTVSDEADQPIDFECPDTVASRWTCRAILEGRTYPHIPFVGEVRTALDVGANCGAMTVHLARHHPTHDETARLLQHETQGTGQHGGDLGL